MVILVAIWTKTAWVEGSSTITGSVLGNAKVDLIVMLGVAAPEQVECFVAFVRLGSCVRQVALSVSFFCTDCMVFRSVSLINWIISFYLFERWIRPPYILKKLLNVLYFSVN